MRLFSVFCAGIILLHLFTGCGGSKKALKDGPPRPATEPRSVEVLLKKLQQRTVETQSIKCLSARAKILSESSDLTISANAQLVWYRDSILWITVKKFGLEAIRAVVTKDSVFVLNRLEKTYSVKSLAALQREYNIPGEASFEMVGQVLFGQATILKDMAFKSDIQDDRHRLLGSQNNLLADYRIEEGSFLLKNESFLEQSKGRAVALAFDSHQKLSGTNVLFPNFRQIEVISPDLGKQTVEIEFSDIEINKTPSVKFEVPGHYKRI